jgi:hypothetical protein
MIEQPPWNKQHNNFTGKLGEAQGKRFEQFY